jgi:hypothetical protein
LIVDHRKILRNKNFGGDGDIDVADNQVISKKLINLNYLLSWARFFDAENLTYSKHTAKRRLLLAIKRPFGHTKPGTSQMDRQTIPALCNIYSMLSQWQDIATWGNVVIMVCNIAFDRYEILGIFS